MKSEVRNGSPRPAAASGPVIAYMMSRFPKISETFILFEILAMEKLGMHVEIYPLLREKQPVSHPEAVRLAARAHFLPFLSGKMLRAHWQMWWKSPWRYCQTLLQVLWATRRNRNFFLGALAYWGKTVAFAQHMQRLQVQHIHAHFCNHPAMSAFAVSRLTGIPYSFTAHGSDLHKDRTMLPEKILASRFAVTVSQFNLQVMRSACPEAGQSKLHVIHCGIDPDIFIPREEVPGNGGLRIICVASFEEVKGHTYLVEACARLRAQGIDFSCDLIGDGPLRQQVSLEIQRRDLQGKITVHGSQPRLEVVRMMRAASVKVLASVPTAEGKREGIPVVLMEAMACGLPVVSSRLSGIPELVEHDRTGILTAPGNVNEIVAALRTLHERPDLRRQMGKAGREKVLREFNLHLSAAELARLFVGNHPLPHASATSAPVPSAV